MVDLGINYLVSFELFYSLAVLENWKCIDSTEHVYGVISEILVWDCDPFLDLK